MTDYAFVLSYGESDNIIPVGIYKFFEEDDEVVTLCKLNKDLTFDEKDAIFMPKRKLEKLLDSQKEHANNTKLLGIYNDRSTEDLVTYIELLEEMLKDETLFKANLKNDPNYDSLLQGKGSNINELNAFYVANGRIASSQYSLMPYKVDQMVKKLELVKTMNRYVDSDIKQGRSLGI